MEKRKAFRKSEPLPASQNSMDMGARRTGGQRKSAKSSSLWLPKEQRWESKSRERTGFARRIFCFPRGNFYDARRIFNVPCCPCWMGARGQIFLFVDWQRGERAMPVESESNRVQNYSLYFGKVLKEHVFLSENFGQRKEESQ